MRLGTAATASISNWENALLIRFLNFAELRQTRDVGSNFVHVQSGYDTGKQSCQTPLTGNTPRDADPQGQFSADLNYLENMYHRIIGLS